MRLHNRVVFRIHEPGMRHFITSEAKASPQESISQKQSPLNLNLLLLNTKQATITSFKQGRANEMRRPFSYELPHMSVCPLQLRKIQFREECHCSSSTVVLGSQADGCLSSLLDSRQSCLLCLPGLLTLFKKRHLHQKCDT